MPATNTMSRAITYPIRIDLPNDSIVGILCPAFGVGNHEIVDLV